MTKARSSKFSKYIDGYFSLLGNLIIAPVPGALASKVIVEVISDYFKGKLGLTDKEQQDVRERAKKVSEHLVEAGKILNVLQNELDIRNQELGNMIAIIDEKKAEAKHWEDIVSSDKEKSKALIYEIESRISDQMRKELNRDVTRRRIVGAVMWIVTIIVGGIVGVLFQKYVFQ